MQLLLMLCKLALTIESVGITGFLELCVDAKS